MEHARTGSETLLGVNLLVSASLHVGAFFLLVWLQHLAPDLGPVQTTYYVDVVNLPVASPQSGSPVPSKEQGDEVSTAQQAGPMEVPRSTPPKSLGKGPKAPDDRSFEQRLAKLEGKAQEQRQAAALESLRQKVSGGKAGMPGAKGNQAGSDYTAYIHSRLKDAFRDTITFQSKNPYVVVRLTIDPDGRISRTKIEKSSNDKVFENSVQRAITNAEPKILPPPGRTTYEGTFVFKPQGVTQR